MVSEAPSHFAADPELIRYYSRRVDEYDRVYEMPERQRDLALLRRRVADTFAGERVLEIACGTGYWSEVLAGSAQRLMLTDGSLAMLRRAIVRLSPRRPVHLVMDFARPALRAACRPTAVFAGFLWSHLPVDRIGEALAGLHSALPSGARVVWVDNRWVSGSSSPISGRDAGGNQLQERRLADGSCHRVVKNFPPPAEIRRLLADSLLTGPVREVAIESLEYYWWLSYRI